jgi:mannose-6-phosphate isomerase
MGSCGVVSAGRIHLLRNPIQNYAWGSRSAIPELLGAASPASEPQAELWMGAHPSAPSRLSTDEGEVPLDDWIARDPDAVLGAGVAARFGGKLPFLFKVLAAERPLSIQAHPSREQARAGFARENAAGVPIDAAQRCYKDDNHKPELICALTTFRAMNRFRPIPELVERLAALAAPELAAPLDGLRERPDREGLAVCFRGLMTLEAEARRRLVDHAVHCAQGRAGTDAAWGWVARLADDYPGDIGVLAPLLLNVVEMAPGEAMFLPAGELHSYLGGVGVEIMANSDNVLRGGLTPKHVDLQELSAALSFEAGEVEKLHPRPVRRGERRYDAPVDEFALSVLNVESGSPYEAAAQRSVEILLCTSGAGRIVEPARGAVTEFARGNAALVPAAVAAYRIEGDAVLYKASAAN